MISFLYVVLFFFFKQKTAYEMRISDWSSDVCSSDLYSPAFLALNPIGKYPVLIDGEGAAAGQPIFESCAILIYLAETYGPELLPKTGAARWEALEWLMAQAAWVGPMLGQHTYFRIQPSEAGSHAATDRKSTRLNSSH